ncbi:hypothetical protein N9N28_08685 [Rubripirellula amarantea]|uniref:Uncharacterized protein n=1 Tax=Rubripirellula amarantea TaxID=2527999 RepID=A0A5C5WRR4_9BACT|nr:hypothetical protein [Rubripirellula amarantea]MDA8744694.1 hypothetical protein [Rubripirellula amarantea]TWT52743.1 hypothetical protein Pla22_03690 [Rubripirellula amarantea]
MKIHSFHPCSQSVHQNASRVTRLLMICGAAFMGLASSSEAMAQSSSGSQGGNAVRNGLFTHGGEDYRVVDTASYRTSADQKEQSAIKQVGLLQHASGHCSSCGTSSCGGSCGTISMATGTCGSCGTSCGGRCGHRVSGLSCNGAFANSCEPCSPYRYASVEAMYFKRDNDDFSLSPNFGMDGFDYEWAPRITIGMVGDCVHGYEASFVGPLEWQQRGNDASATDSIGTFFGRTLVGNAATTLGTDLSFLTDASVADQRLSAEYYSLEASKTLVGWEMAKLLIGGRYINYDEDYLYAATSGTSGQTGNLNISTDNQLIGVQIGADLLFPISRHGFSDTRMRAGVYANNASTDQSIVKSTGYSIADSDSSTEIAGMFELGTGVRYQLGEILSVRAGAELWYLTGVATADSQASFTAAQLTQRQGVQAEDDILFTGLSVGAELRY